MLGSLSLDGAPVGCWVSEGEGRAWRLTAAAGGRARNARGPRRMLSRGAGEELSPAVGGDWF